jgi:hypothetical protein
MRQNPRYGVRVERKGVVRVWYLDYCGDRQDRTWAVVGQDSGYVYDITDHPGTLGQQVMDAGPHVQAGTTLSCSRASLPGRARYILRYLADHQED